MLTDHLQPVPFLYSTQTIMGKTMESSVDSVMLDSDESDDEINDKMSITSSRSKDGRFVKTGSKTVHPCPHSDCDKFFT